MNTNCSFFSFNNQFITDFFAFYMLNLYKIPFIPYFRQFFIALKDVSSTQPLTKKMPIVQDSISTHQNRLPCLETCLVRRNRRINLRSQDTIDHMIFSQWRANVHSAILGLRLDRNSISHVVYKSFEQDVPFCKGVFYINKSDS